jgi:hypothetical protein
MTADKQPELGRHCLERVTGIEPALSAWESDRLGLLTALTWALDAPLVTVIDPATPGLMARGPDWLGRRRASPRYAWHGAWFWGSSVASGSLSVATSARHVRQTRRCWP